MKCLAVTVWLPLSTWAFVPHVPPRHNAFPRQLPRVFSTIDVEAEPPQPIETPQTIEPPKPIESDDSVVESYDKSDLVATVGDGLSKEITSSQRIVVNELLLKLEASNPTESPATSPLLNGVWELVYSAGYSNGLLQSPTRQIALFLYAGGYAPSQLGLQLARLLPASVLEISDISLQFSRDQPRATASSTVKVGSTETKVKIQSTVETESDVRIKETYTSLTVADRDIEVPSSLAYSRLLFITYLDDDLLIVRDESGVPDILLRKSKEFVLDSTNTNTGEPSAADDDLAPGAG